MKIVDLDTKVEMMELLLNKLTELHCVATELGDEDTANAISCAEDTLINSIKHEKDVQLALSIVNKNKGG